jgi:hypothetical protein
VAALQLTFEVGHDPEDDIAFRRAPDAIELSLSLAPWLHMVVRLHPGTYDALRAVLSGAPPDVSTPAPIRGGGVVMAGEADEGELDDTGRLLLAYEAVQQLASCFRLGETPAEQLLVKVAECDRWVEQIKTIRKAAGVPGGGEYPG